jgi:Icc-related predicted phosphoesterase
MSTSVKVVIVSDTHCSHAFIKNIPDGDILLHCGDFTERGEWKEMTETVEWMGKLPHKHKLMIGGNHDLCASRSTDKTRAYLLKYGIQYLFNQKVTIRGLTIYGTPLMAYGAFQLRDIVARRKHFINLFSDATGIDILMTHSPPQAVLDQTRSGNSAGCAAILEGCKVVAPLLAAFGHIHEARGIVAKTVDEIKPVFPDYASLAPPAKKTWNLGKQPPHQQEQQQQQQTLLAASDASTTTTVTRPFVSGLLMSRMHPKQMVGHMQALQTQ